MVEKFKITKEFQMKTLLSNTYWIGLELNIKDNIVMDGCVKLFDVNSEFAKEHGVIVSRLF